MGWKPERQEEKNEGCYFRRKVIVFKCLPYAVIWVHNVKRRNKIPDVACDSLEPTELNFKLIMVAKLVAPQFTYY